MASEKPVIDYALSLAYPEVWKAMEVLVDKGKAKAIGEFSVLKLRQTITYPSTSTGERVHFEHELKKMKKRPFEFQYSEDEADPGMRENQTSGQSG